MDDESGSSSGVDTDSVPVSRDHESPITVRIVEVTPGNFSGGRLNTDLSDRNILHSNEAISASSYSAARINSASYVDVQCGHENEEGNFCNPFQDSVSNSKSTLDGEESVSKSLPTQGTSYFDGYPSKETSDELLRVPVRALQVPSVNPFREDTTLTVPSAPCTVELVEGAPEVCGAAEYTPQEGEMLERSPPQLFPKEMNPDNHLPPVSGEEKKRHTQPEVTIISSDGSAPVTRRSDENLGTQHCTTPSLQYLSSAEGDVSDIEADFEEPQLIKSDHSASDSNLTNSDKKRSGSYPCDQSALSLPSAAATFPKDKFLESANVGVGNDQAASACCETLADHELEEGAVAVAVAAALLEEPSEEQSSGSGTKGSASASVDDSDRGRRRNRPRGRRKRRGGKSALYQATEAEAHFMFELAKTVLTKAGGNSSTSVFTQAASSDAQNGPHRVLQLCAFEIGLFALGLHNRTSQNWLSRTYSSHVSWISGQAMEIGHQAITLLLERWEGNLTPSEVTSIADRASKSNDRAMVRAAAELGLSCLHMATTLNPAEIQRALSQCRDEDSQLLDQACQAVESAARGGGVYPEVLFDVAKHWFYLHEKNQTNSSASRPAKSESRSRGSLSRSSQSTSSSSHSPPLSPFMPQLPQFTIPLGYSSIPPPLYTTPEQYVQQQMHQQVHQMMGHYPAYLSGNNSGYRCGSQSHYSYPFSRTLPGTQFSLSGAYAGLTPPPYQTTSVSSSPSQHGSRLTAAQQGPQVTYYLNSAYRVGMLALEFLSRRTSDDRPNVTFSRNPSCSEDIKWLCTLSGKLGNSHLQRFCVAALNAVVSPFILHDLALEAARHMARSNPAQLAANLRSPTISPLVQKSLTMYAQCIRYKLMNISQNDYDEFVDLLRHARGAFCMAPGGMTQFNELLQSIRRGHSKKKELWQMIMTGLAKA